MKNSRLALLILSTALISNAALAASVTMLQFGSYETRGEAQKRLSDISTKYRDQLGTLGLSIREVPLPTGNLTVYRTQAGPVENRAAAQGICAKLASSGDECYIVQSAMIGKAEPFAPGAAATAVAAAAPAPTKDIIAPAASAPVVEAAPTVMLEPITPPTIEAPDLTSKLSSLQEAPVEEMKTPEPALTEQAPAPETAPLADAAPVTQMQEALDSAAADTASAEESVAAATVAAAPKRTRSFWSWLNPFDDDEEEEVAAAAPESASTPAETAAVEETPKPADAPIAEVAPPAPEMANAAAPEPTPAPEAPMAPMAPMMPMESTQLPPAMPTDIATSQAPATFEQTPVITHADPLPLPAPPLPTSEKDREALAQQKIATIQQQTPQPPEMLSEPMKPTTGAVQVDEATRVPLSEAITAEPAPAAPTKPMLQPDVSLSPSAGEGQKTVWAQVGPFADSEQALAFWSSYRQANPDFPVVRVRTVSGYQQQLSGINRSWLRIGPVSRAAFANALCDSLKETKLRCGLITDAGITLPVKGDKK